MRHDRYMRLAAMPPRRRAAVSGRQRAWRVVLKFLLFFIACFVLGLSFYLRVTPALPVQIPVISQKAEPSTEPKRPELGRHL